LCATDCADIAAGTRPDDDNVIVRHDVSFLICWGGGFAPVSASGASPKVYLER
jgi:hypothetical protein